MTVESREADDRIPKGCVYNLLSEATCSRGSFRCDRKHRSKPAQGLVCPFCDDDDFDAIGLKIHLTTYCEAFRALEVGTRVY